MCVFLVQKKSFLINEFVLTILEAFSSYLF